MHSIHLSRTGRTVVAGAAAVLAALAMAAPSGAATTDSSFSWGMTSDSGYSWGATSLNFAEPGDTLSLHFT